MITFSSQNVFNFNAAYQMIRKKSESSGIHSFAQWNFADAFNNTKDFLWKNRVWVVGGSIIAIAIFTLYYLWKNRTQPLLVKMETTLNFAALSIAIPKEKPLPPNVTLTFCVDTSASMQGVREDAVKKAVKSVLESAQKVVDKTKEAKIQIAIIGFDDKPKVITSGIKLIPSSQVMDPNSPVEKIRQQLASIYSNGGTKILDGLEKATEVLEKMAEDDRNASHTLIFLSDGGDSLNKSRVSSLHTRLASANVNLFAIGIGSGHSEQTLREIAPDNKTGFKGTYIDTTLGLDTIESAISKIYKQAIATYQNLELTSSQLGPGTWSVINMPTSIENGRATCKLGSLSEEDKFLKVIKIHGDKLPAPLDLSHVLFQLTYQDSKGHKGNVVLPWDPTPTIEPKIIQTAEAEIKRGSSGLPGGHNPITI